MNDEIIKEYTNGVSINSLAKKYNSTPYMIKKILIANNIKIRTAHEQTSISNLNRAIKINDNYFSKLNLENSYYLGFIAADGTVRKDNNEIKITINNEDEQFLLDMKNKMDYKGNLHYQNKVNAIEYRFSSKQIKKDLAKYSIIPRKTYIGITMKDIPDEYKLAFIKGYYDGDGNVSINQNTKQVSIKIVSHTEEILKEFQNTIKQKTNIYANIRGTILYSLELSTLPALDFLKDIYSLNTPYLQRKYDKYLEILNIRI